MYDRQDQEVATLRLLQPADLLQFATDKLLQPASRRKVTVQVRGSAEAVATASSADSTATAAAALPEISGTIPTEVAESVAGKVLETSDQPSVVAEACAATDAVAVAEGCHSIKNIMMWKRSCEIWPNVAAASRPLVSKS